MPITAVTKLPKILTDKRPISAAIKYPKLSRGNLNNNNTETGPTDD